MWKNIVERVRPQKTTWSMLIVCWITKAAVTVYSAPDDGRKERPKHVDHICNC